MTVLFNVMVLPNFGGSSKSEILHDLCTLAFKTMVWSRTTIARGGFSRALSENVVVLVKETNEVSGSCSSSLSKTAWTLLSENCLTSFVPAFQSNSEDIVNLVHTYECNCSAVDVINMQLSGEFFFMLPLPLPQGKTRICSSR